jgi:hypothetical protein
VKEVRLKGVKIIYVSMSLCAYNSGNFKLTHRNTKPFKWMFGDEGRDRDRFLRGSRTA